MKTASPTSTRCWFCDMPISKGNLERDHWPIPKSAGGEELVDSCRTCHDMKDRFTLQTWPPELVAAVHRELAALWPSLSRETRLYVSKGIAVAANALVLIHKEEQS